VQARTTRGSQRIVVEGDGAGNWTVGGLRRPELVGCRDVDLESSACTNTFPVHRMKLMVGQRCEAPAAYVRALDATVERLEQSYRRLDDAGGQHVYHYESPGFDFVARLTYDDRGLVVDYPGIATRCF
jgi:hypothetical protein